MLKYISNSITIFKVTRSEKKLFLRLNVKFVNYYLFMFINKITLQVLCNSSATLQNIDWDKLVWKSCTMLMSFSRTFHTIASIALVPLQCQGWLYHISILSIFRQFNIYPIDLRSFLKFLFLHYLGKSTVICISR